MVEVFRNRVTWSGASGGAGTTTFHITRTAADTATAAHLAAAQAAMRTIYENTAEWCPNDVTTTVQQTADELDSATGLLVSSLTASSAQTAVPGSYTGNWQNGVGTRIIWETGLVNNGRRIRGFTYLVPYGGIFDNDGTLSAAAASDITGVATSYISALATAGWLPVVFSHTYHSAAQITSGRVTDKTVVLRTRRD